VAAAGHDVSEIGALVHGGHRTHRRPDPAVTQRATTDPSAARQDDNTGGWCGASE
jgi:hypothetical protein